MAVDRRQRAHFDRIAEVMAEKTAAAYSDVANSTAAERIRIGFLLGDVPRSAAVEEAIDRDALGQIGLARRRPPRKTVRGR